MVFYTDLPGDHKKEVQAEQPDKDAFTGLTMPAEVRYDIAEHEVMLSFNDDEAALAFHEYWEEVGKISFNKWLKRHEDYFHIAER